MESNIEAYNGITVPLESPRHLSQRSLSLGRSNQTEGGVTDGDADARMTLSEAAKRKSHKIPRLCRQISYMFGRADPMSQVGTTHTCGLCLGPNFLTYLCTTLISFALFAVFSHYLAANATGRLAYDLTCRENVKLFDCFGQVVTYFHTLSATLR